MTPRCLRHTLVIVGSAAALAVFGLVGSAEDCASCWNARYWSDGTFPETGLRGDDFGVAFSGGGTRSASATVGQLRALAHLGWLTHVRYMTAVSGGSWTIVPFAYSKASTDTLLGTVFDPDKLTMANVCADPDDGSASKPCATDGAIRTQIALSNLAAAGVREALAFALQQNADTIKDKIAAQARLQFAAQHFDDIKSALDKLAFPRGMRRDKTYARLLGERFLDTLVETCASPSGDKPCDPRASDRLFTWDSGVVSTMGAAQAGVGSALPADVLIANPNRPFMIVGSTLVVPQKSGGYPDLVPVEFTPIYSGTRRAAGSRGTPGTYVWSWAYDAVQLARGKTKGFVRARVDPDHPFSLADVIAASGAAPQLDLLRADGVPAPLKKYVTMAATFFPAFAPFSVAADGSAKVAEALPHSDGGLSDNFGLMPLLERHVTNVLVFFNTNTPLVQQNDDVKSLFMPVGTPDGGGDKTVNVVFDGREYQPMIEAMLAQKDAGEPQIYCKAGLSVQKNTNYNITPYRVNLCLFYNADAKSWHDAITDDRVKAVFSDPYATKHHLDDFPSYRTFEQNTGKVIQLTPMQINLLADFAGWMVARPETVDLVKHTLSVPLP